MLSPKLSLSDLPLELFRAILIEAVRVRGLKRALILRLVCSAYAVFPVYFAILTAQSRSFLRRDA